jgi:hypothetical protein
MISSGNIVGVNLPLLAKPIKTNAYEIGKAYDGTKNHLNSFLKLKNDKFFKRKKKKKRKKFEDRIKDIEHNYINDMRDNSYLMSYGPGAIGF